MITNKNSTIILLSLFTLTACNDDNSNSQPPVVQQKTEQWVKFQIPGNPISNEDDSISEYSSVAVTIKDGKLYEKKYHPLLSSIGQEPLLVTLDSIYKNGPENKDYGTLIGDITVTNTDWLVKPYSPININQLEIKSEYKLINIGGQNILESIEPNLAINYKNIPYTDDLYSPSQHDLISRIKDKKFPTGATCLQLQKTTQNQDSLQLTLAADQVEVKNAWDNEYEVKLPDYYKQTQAYLATTANAINPFYKLDLTYLMDNVTYYLGIAKYDNKYYYAKKINKGTRFDPGVFNTYNFDYYKNNIDVFYPEQGVSAQFTKALAQSCDYLDPVATKAVYDILGTPEVK